MKFDPYSDMRTIESDNFTLRLVSFDDAERLVGCYSDPLAALTFTDDNCDFGFFVRNSDGVRNMIHFWLEEYGNKVYARLAIVPKGCASAVGTIELFNRGRHGQYDDVGILRLDIESAYETKANIRELVSAVMFDLSDAFDIKALLIYAPEIAAARVSALKSLGFRDTKAGELVMWTDWRFAAVADFKAACVEHYWKSFLKDTGRDANTAYFECDHFEYTEAAARKLLDLVLSGKKRATASSAYAYQAERSQLPKVGDLSIITDYNGRPECVVETTRVTVLPFRDMTFEICSREGEDDCLESWRQNHIDFFTQDGKETGYAFSEDMPVVFEDFAVVYRNPAPEAESPAFALGKNTEDMLKAIETVKAFAEKADELLGGAIAAAYLCGSAAYADFHPRISDLDFFFISSRRLTRQDFDAFHALYGEYRSMNDGFFSVLEGEIVYAGALDYSESDAIYWGTSGDKFKNRMSISGFSAKGLFKRGMIVKGRDMRYDIDKPDSDTMRAQARRMVETVREHAALTGDNGKYADWLFLLAQTMYYLVVNDTTCKTRAAEWLLSCGAVRERESGVKAAISIRNGKLEYSRDMGIEIKDAIFGLADMVEEKLNGVQS